MNFYKGLIAGIITFSLVAGCGGKIDNPGDVIVEAEDDEEVVEDTVIVEEEEEEVV